MLRYHTYHRKVYSEMHSVSKSCAADNILEEGQQTSDCTPHHYMDRDHESYDVLSAYPKLDLSMSDTKYINRQYH